MSRQMRTAAVLVCLAALLVCGAARAADAPDGAPASIAGKPLAEAVQEDPGLAELAGYLQEAALANRDLRASFNRWKAALERVPQAAGIPDPRFTYGYYIVPIETRTGPQRNRLSLAQTFPWFGKLDLKASVAGREAAIYGAQLEAQRLALYSLIKDAYYEYAYLGRAVAVTRENIGLMQYLADVAQARYASGQGAYGDVLKPQVELDRLEDRLRSLEDLRRPLSAKLAAAMDKPVDVLLPWPRTLPEMVTSCPDADLFSRLKEENPRLKILALTEQKEGLSGELAKKNWFPDLTLALDYIFTDPARVPGMTNEGENPIIASVSLNLPIFYEKYAAAVREADFRRQAAIQDKAGLENQLSSSMELALYKYRDAHRRLSLYRELLIPKAEQTLAVTLTGFQSGGAGALDLIDAEKTLIELELSFERALADQAQRLAEMEQLVGGEIACDIHGAVSPRHAPLTPDLTVKTPKAK